MAKLGMPNRKWTKASELDSFITSTIPKEVVQNNNAAQKTQRLWLKTSSLQAAIVDKTDGGENSGGKIIQGIRNTLLLLGMRPNNTLSSEGRPFYNTWTQLKPLVQDADFAEAPPYLFGTNFGELAKERWEVAALIQNAQKSQNFLKCHPQKFSSWGHRSGCQTFKAPAKEEGTTLGV